MTRGWLVGGVLAVLVGFAAAYAIGSAGKEDSAATGVGTVQELRRPSSSPTAAGLDSAAALPSLRRAAPANTVRTQSTRSVQPTQTRPAQPVRPQPPKPPKPTDPVTQEERQE